MRLIRSSDYGGRGRLEERQVDMLDSSGRLVPVKISAALIYKHGRPVGSVGVFTDIREQMRMQASLRQAEDKLREHERNTAVAQLAGATAHELNQPLTSVITHAEWLRRHAGNDPKFASATEVLIDQAERMAAIVRQIGKITKYETRTYVGGSQILDLEKSSEVPAGSPSSPPQSDTGDAATERSSSELRSPDLHRGN
jgi:signal transduction histidine kinase